MRVDATRPRPPGTPTRAGLLLALLAALAGGSVAAWGCAPDFRGASELDETNQVLAVRVTPPEVNPGTTVTLDALVHWPEGAPTLFWLVCIPDVGDTFLSCLSGRIGDAMDIPLCGVDPADRLCLAGVGDAVSYPVPEGIFPDDGEDHTFFVNMLAAGADIETCAEVMMGGAPTPDCLLSLKRVVVSYRPPAELNVNPEPTHLVFDGSDLDPGAVVTVDATAEDDNNIELEVAVTVAATSVNELYPPDGEPSPFDLVVSFFTTCGDFDKEKLFLPCAPGEGSGDAACDPARVKWHPRARGACTVHTVIRDGDGGLGWLTQQFEIR